MADYTGTSGDDVLRGTSEADTFNLQDGGSDKAVGGGGADLFRLGGGFGTSDRILGGGGVDTIVLDGDYSGGLTINGSMLTSVEQLKVGAGHDYDLTIANDVVRPGNQNSLAIDGDGLGSGDDMRIDASGIDHGHVTIYAGGGDDFLAGGEAANAFFLRGGGDDTVIGGGGDDYVAVDSAFTAGDSLDGGDGFDVVSFNGGDALIALGAAVRDFETIFLTGAAQFDLVATDEALDHGEVLALYSQRKSTLSFDGSAETDGRWDLRSGALGDHLVGGARADTFFSGGGGDTLQGGAGGDTMDAGGGHDWFVYASVGDSTVDAPDIIWRIEAGDVLDLSAIDADVTRDGDQKFHLVSAFTHHAAELLLVHDGDLQVLADIDGDGVADMKVQFAGGDTDFSHFKL